jgi:carboxypeptidase family protein
MSHFSRALRLVSHLFLVLMLVGVTEWHAAAQPTPVVGSGVVEGRVVDAATGDPLPGAQVLVTGSAAETFTDRDGRFRLSAVPAGDRTVVVTYLGRQDATVEAKVVAGATQRLDIQMRMVAFEESVSVPGQLILDAATRSSSQSMACNIR